MKILSIDTSSEICGVSLLEDDRLIDDNSISDGKTHSENLMPLIKQILERNNTELRDIELIACVVGPGSFTGIRIGVAAVKALSEVNKIPVAEITSLEVLAKNIKDNCQTKVSLIDARNNQVYCGIFDNEINLIQDYLADDINKVLEYLKNYKDICFCGNGAILHVDTIRKCFEDAKVCEDIKQSAYNAGVLGYKKFKANDIKDADTVLPIYLRKSQAERMKQNNE